MARVSKDCLFCNFLVLEKCFFSISVLRNIYFCFLVLKIIYYSFQFPKNAIFVSSRNVISVFQFSTIFIFIFLVPEKLCPKKRPLPATPDQLRYTLNTLAHYGNPLLTAVKSFKVQSPWNLKLKHLVKIWSYFGVSICN